MRVVLRLKSMFRRISSGIKRSGFAATMANPKTNRISLYEDFRYFALISSAF